MAIYLEIDKNRINLFSKSYDPDVSERAKTIVGYGSRWDGDLFICWTFPLSWITCLELRKKFGKDILLGKELKTWAKAEKRRREELQNIAKQAGLDLPQVARVAPELAAALATRPYQQVGAAFMAQAKNVLNADMPRLGKTLQTMAALVLADVKGSIIVAAPSSAAKVTWPSELSKWLPDDLFFVVSGPRPIRQETVEIWKQAVKKYGKKHRIWLCCNFEIFRANKQKTTHCPQKGNLEWTMSVDKQVTKGHWHHPYSDLFTIEHSAIIVDESHRALVTQTHVISRMKTQVRAGLSLLKIQEDGIKIALSGTPNRSKRELLWGTFNWLDPKIYNSYWNWAKIWFDIDEGDFNASIGDIKPIREAQFYKELDSIMIRRTKQEVRSDLPDKMYAGRPLNPDFPEYGIGHWIEMSPTQDKIYEQMSKLGEANLNSGTLVGNGVLSEMTRLKQFATCSGDLKISGSGLDIKISYIPELPSNKFDWILDFLDERGILPVSGEPWGDSKIVIASQYTSILNLFRDELHHLGLETLILTGRISDRDRSRSVELFQGAGGPRVFFINTIAGGVSITLDAAEEMIILDETWIVDDQTQVENRIEPTSTTSDKKIIIHYLRSLGTIEEKIAALNENRDNLQRQMLDGRRGVDFSRKLLRR